ncbi:MAG: MFS transporter [Deltaproteobacteria bacterium]|nr:MFS transporter [Candidatus Anaeroferrophillacea bacterium]
MSAAMSDAGRRAPGVITPENGTPAVHAGRWGVFAIVISLYFLSYFFRCSTAVIAPDLGRDFGIGPEALGLLSSMYFYPFALAQFPLGPALDRVGPRTVGCVMGLLAAAGAMIFAIAPTFPLALLGRGLIGLGVSVAYMGTLKIIAHWFERDEFAMMSALAMAIGNIGALTATAPLALAAGLMGWRATFVVLGVLTVLSALAIRYRVRNYPPDRIPESAAMPGSDSGAESTPAPRAVPSRTGNESPVPGAADNRPTVGDAFRRVLGSRTFWGVAVFEFFWFGSFIGIQGLWGGPYLMDVFGFTSARAGAMLGMIAIGFIVGGPVLGRLSDRVFHTRKGVVIGGMAVYVMVLAVLVTLRRLPHPGFFYPLFFLFGFAGSSGIIGYAHIKEVFPLSISATVMTNINFFAIAGAAVVQHLMGFIIERFEPTAGVYPFAAYRAAFLFCLVGMIIAVGVYSRTRETGTATSDVS